MGNHSKLTGKKVVHKTFGEGVVTHIIDSKLYVKFEKYKEEKHFTYPDCFKTFLKQVDDSGADIIAIDVVKRNFEKIYETKQRQLEVLHKVEEKASRKKEATHASVQLEAFTNVPEFIQRYSEALYQEINFLKNEGEKKIHLTDGQFIVKSGGQYTYVFQADTELNYPGETQITIWSQKGSASGCILYCEDFTVTLASTTDLGGRVSQIEIAAETWMLLEGLCKRLTNLTEHSVSPIVQELICDGTSQILYDQDIVKGQEKAVDLSFEQPITFIWGPPGTGKTETLSRIALAHIKQGKRVLMLSYSNVSVDGAAWRVMSNDDEQKPGKIVRYGYAKNEQVLLHPFLTTAKLVLKNYENLEIEQNNLLNELKHFSPEQRNVPRYVELKKRIQEIRKKLKEAEAKAVHEAKFVATTVSKATIDQAIYTDQYDVVLFDEASMAYVPQIIFSASLAKSHFICLGDFAQLPPIVPSSDQSILNVDIFEYCGITDAVAKECGHRWLCLLDTQYRMDPRIAGFASIAMYKGLLDSAPEVRKLREQIVESEPFKGHPIVMADLSGMMSVCSKMPDFSRVNPLSALISFGIALNAAENNAVGIITPYQAQSRLLHALVRDVTNEKIHKITCATVHQFQGSEQDIVLYDAVDCYRQRYPGMLLTSLHNNYANRLFNVAMTRAKGKFITVANVAYFENKMISSALMFAKLIKHCKYTPFCVGGKELLHIAAPEQRKFREYQSYEGNSGDQYFFEDLLDAKHEVRINIPGTLEQDERYLKDFVQVLYVVQSHQVNVILRTEHKENLPKELRKYAVEILNICDPIAIIDKKVTWFGEPHSAADFISCGDTFSTRWRPIIRFEGENTAKCLYNLLEMNQTIDRAPDIKLMSSETETLERYISTHKVCAQCGRPMKLKQAKKGGFFLSCSSYPACNYTEKVTKEFVEIYLNSDSGKKVRCKYDRTSLETRIGPNGVYLQCCGRLKHKYALNQI